MNDILEQLGLWLYTVKVAGEDGKTKDTIDAFARSKEEAIARLVAHDARDAKTLTATPWSLDEMCNWTKDAELVRLFELVRPQVEQELLAKEAPISAIRVVRPARRV